MDARQDERGREVRARLLRKPFHKASRLPSLAVLAGLALFVPAAGASAASDTTGRLLVTLDRSGHTAHRAQAAAVAASAGARRAGFSVPQIGLVTLRPRRGESLRALVRRLRHDPRVARVEQETRAYPRYDPDDPALRDQETAAGTAPGTPVEWWAAREGFPAAWQIERGDGAVVAVIDTGVESTHPDLAPSILAAASFDPGAGPGTADDVGHGTHVASLACAAGDNGIGLAGAGLHCKLLVMKSDFTDSSVAAGIVWAVDHGADAINMSFGTNPGTHPTTPILRAIDYAYLQGTSMAVPMVAATAALVKKLNPDLTAADVIRLIKQTAQRPAGAGWNPDLGWGILSAGAALSVAQRLDRRPPQSVIAKPPTRTHRRAIRLRWSGKDFAPPSVLLTGLARYELWESVNAGRYRRVYSGRSKSKLVRLRPGWRYAFYTVAVDRAGNGERPPAIPDATIKALP